ncbi:MAG: helix-hairpin-helix domain-containing protein [Haliscomenobacter sp.]|nr:helix-hairpin-helix domain-containing protein [Haliscomenobacter sp.]
MTDPVFQALIPFMMVSRQDPGVREGQEWNRPDSSPVSKSYYRPKTCAELEVNTSDSIAWESLPGIGPVLASRILKFRQRLGGFAFVDQVRETYGLPDSTFKNPALPNPDHCSQKTGYQPARRRGDEEPSVYRVQTGKNSDRLPAAPRPVPVFRGLVPDSGRVEGGLGETGALP